MKTQNSPESKENPSDIYPGATINKADDEKVDERLVKERTKTQNNNPENEFIVDD